MNRAVVHSGDARGDADRGSQETITVRPAALDPRATAVVFFARVHEDTSTLGLVSSATVSLTGPDVTITPLAHHEGSKAAIVCRMFRDGGGSGGGLSVGGRGAAALCVETMDVPFADADMATLVPRCQNVLRDVVDVSANPDCRLVLLDKGGLLTIEGWRARVGVSQGFGVATARAGLASCWASAGTRRCRGSPWTWTWAPSCWTATASITTSSTSTSSRPRAGAGADDASAANGRGRDAAHAYATPP